MPPLPWLPLLLVACSGNERPEPPVAAAPSVPSGEGATSPPVGDAPPPPVGLDDLEPCEGGTVVGALEAVIRGRASPCEQEVYLTLLRARAYHVGPWMQDLWVVPSPDGRSFDLSRATMVRADGAVPEVIVHEGRFYLFYGEGRIDLDFVPEGERMGWFRDHGLLGFGALNLLVSDDGLHFEPVPGFGIEGLLPGMVVDPDVIRLPDGRFRMYYVGLSLEELSADGAWDDDAQHDVYYAESEDLIQWRQLGVAVHGPIADPSVWCEADDRCRMFSTGLDHSHSSDGGRRFHFDDATAIEGFAPELLELDGALRHYYNAMRQGGPLMFRESEDRGRTWSPPEEVVPAYRVEAPSFAPHPSGEGWLMYYHYYSEEVRHVYPPRPEGARARPGTGEGPPPEGRGRGEGS